MDCGIVVNPDGVRGQIEGGLLFGLSTALKESGTVTNGAFDQRNFDDYQLLRMDEVPEVEIHIVESTEPPSGIGEPPSQSLRRRSATRSLRRQARGCAICRSFPSEFE